MKWWIITLLALGFISSYVVGHIIQDRYMEGETFASFLPSVSAEVEDAIEYNSIYSKYGHYPGQKLFIARDGLQYNPRDNGGMRILDQGGNEVVTYGTCMSGKVEGQPITACEPDYEWTWTHTIEDVYFTQLELNSTDDVVNVTYVMQKDIFTGYNNNPNLNWTKIYEFTPKDDVKITDIITNNFADVTNVKFWYVMKEPGIIRYNGREYNTSEVEVNKQGNFNNVISNVDFGAGSFLYQDMLDDGFDLVHIYIGNGTPIGYDKTRILGLAFTKGSGNFNLDQTFVLDPISTGFKTAFSFEDPASGWTNPGNAQIDDGVYATALIGQLGEVTWTGGYSFGLPANAINITGFEIELIGISKAPFCVARVEARASIILSLDNATTLSSESASKPYSCTTGTTNSIRIFGSSTDTFGLGAMNVSNITSDFRAAFKFFSSTGGGLFNPGIDSIRTAVFYDTPVPIIFSAEDNIQTGTVINATFTVNLTTANDVDLTSALFESNYTGVLTNYSLDEEGSTNFWSRIFEGNNGSLDGDEGARNGTINMTGTFWVIAGSNSDTAEMFDVNVSSIPPNISINNPLDDSNQWLGQPGFFNITNIDEDGDSVDIALFSTYGGVKDLRNYLHFMDSVTNGSEVIHNQTIGMIDANQSDLVRLLRLDCLSRFDEVCTSVGDTLYYDSSNRNINGTQGENTAPGSCTAQTITPLVDECVEFDGDEVIQLLNGTDTEFAEVFATGNYTIATWFYDRDSSQEAIFMKGGSATEDRYFELSHLTDIWVWRLRNRTDLVCNVVGTGTSQNNWHHIAISSQDGIVSAYTDGVLVDTEDCSDVVINVTRWAEDSPTFETNLGAGGAGAEFQQFDGAIDMFAMWNRSLSAREVMNLIKMNSFREDWTTRIWEESGSFVDVDSTFFNFRRQINVTEEVTLEELFTNVTLELPDDPSLLNFSDATTPCRYVASKSIHILTGGHLILESCTLEMNNSEESGEFDLVVSETGKLTANYSNFSKASTQRYEFRVIEDSTLVLKNSFVSFTGRGNIDTFRGLFLNTTNIIFENNTLSKAAYSDLEIRTSNLNIKNSRILGNDGSGSATDHNVFCELCTNVTFIDSIISGSSGANVVVLDNQNLTLLNTTSANHNVQSGGLLTVDWYINGLVQNSSGPINGSRVLFYNALGILKHNITTNSSGNIPQQNVTEYIVNSSGKIYQTNYTINASAVGHDSKEIQFNFTTSDDFTMTLDVSGAAPSCIIDCTLTGLISGSIDCLGSALSFRGVDRTTDSVRLGSGVQITNWPTFNIFQCRVIGIGGIFS